MCRDNELKKAEKVSLDFFVKCPVCGAIYKNHFGSLPCCGSLPYEFIISDLIDHPHPLDIKKH